MLHIHKRQQNEGGGSMPISLTPMTFIESAAPTSVTSSQICHIHLRRGNSPATTAVWEISLRLGGSEESTGRNASAECVATQDGSS